MGSLVPPPSSDNFTSELCVFLSALAKTSGTQFQDLTSQLVKLREVLLKEVVRESSDSENDSSSDSDSNTIEDTISEKTLNFEGGEEESYAGIQESFDKSDCRVKSAATKSRGATNHRVMLSLQKGARYELEKRQLIQAFSEYGKIIRTVLYEDCRSGSLGYIEFRTSQSATGAINKVVQAGKCSIHTSLPMSLLSEVPIPYQILLESRYLPHVWEKEIVLRSFFAKYGVVTGVQMWFRKGFQRCIISFKEASVAQNLIGTTVKILTCTVVIKEVSSFTINGGLDVKNAGVSYDYADNDVTGGGGGDA